MVKHLDGPDAPEGPDAFEERVREALHRETDTVEPSGGGLGAIQARTASAGRRARTRWVTGGAAVLATAAAVTAIAVVGSTGLGLGPDPAPQPAPPPAGEAAEGPPLQIFYLDSTPEQRGEPGSVTVDDPGLYRELRPAPAGGDRVEAAVRELAASQPTDPDYLNPWDQATVRSVRVETDQVTVDVSRPPRGEAPEQQLAHTVAAALGRSVPVRLLEDGDPVDTIEPAPAVGTYAAIWVLEPEQGSAVTGPVRFSGMAATFEGNVAYEILRGGEEVASGATTSRGGMGVWSQWSFTERLEPGDYTLVAFTEDPALGGRRDIDTKSFTVR
jgi:hypothetical protein